MRVQVKNQGGCGSCWAFSATETLESALAKAGGPLLELSPQEIVSCAPNPDHCGGTGGCSGSTQPLAFNYTKTAGEVLDSKYKYTASTGTCSASKIKNPAMGIKGYEVLPTNDYSALMNAVATAGPIAISVDASWGAYEEGVFTCSDYKSTLCGTSIDHAVQLVGYGTEDNQDYWRETRAEPATRPHAPVPGPACRSHGPGDRHFAPLGGRLVRNSWGASWGQGGYIKIARYGASSAGEPCGVDKHPGDGYACAGGPKTLPVCGVSGILSASSYVTGAFAY